MVYVTLNDLKKLHKWIINKISNDLKNYFNSNNIKVTVSIYDYKTIINIRYNSNIDTLKINRLLNFNKLNGIFIYYNDKKNTKYDIEFNSLCIGLLNKDLLINVQRLHEFLNNKEVIAIKFNNKELELLKELKDNNSFKYEKNFFTLKELELLKNKELELLSEKTNYNFKKIINYTLKTNSENIKKINNVLNYYSNNKHNKKNIRIGKNYLRIIINSYNIYDNDNYNKKDTLEDYLNTKIDLNKDYKDYYLY